MVATRLASSPALTHKKNIRKEGDASGRIRPDENRNIDLRNSISGSEGFTLTWLTNQSGLKN